MDLKLLQIQKILENIEADSPKLDIEKLASEPQRTTSHNVESVDLTEVKEKLEKVAEHILKFVDSNTNPLVKFASANKLSENEMKALFLASLYNKTLLNLKSAADEDKEIDEDKSEEEKDMGGASEEGDMTSPEDEAAADLGKEDMSDLSDLGGSIDEVGESGSGADEEGQKLGDVLREIENILDETAPENVGESGSPEEDLMKAPDEGSPEEGEEAVTETEEEVPVEDEELNKKSSFYKKSNKEIKDDSVCPDCRESPCVCEEKKEKGEPDEDSPEKDAAPEEYETLKTAMYDEDNVACLSEVLKDMKINPEKLPKMINDNHVIKKAIANKIATDVTVYRLKNSNTKKAHVVDNEIKMLMKSYLKSLLNI